jgi:protein phosphatase
VITRALGMKATVQVDISAADVKDGDIFLLCSDGLSGMVETPTLRDLLKVDVDLDDAAHKLVEAANQAGGTDNITVLLLECRQN